MQPFLSSVQVVLIATCLNVWNSALPSTLPPHSIASRSIGPATQHAPLFNRVNHRLQRRRTRRQPDWEEEEEEWDANDNNNDDDDDDSEEEDDYQDELPIEQEESLPPTWEPEQEEEEHHVRVASIPVEQEEEEAPLPPVRVEEPLAAPPLRPHQQEEQRVRVASAPVQDTTMASSGMVEDTTPVVAAVFRPDMRHDVDYSKVPATAPKPVGSGLCPGSQCAPGDCERCWETCGNCPRPDDYYGCKDKTQWSLTFDDGPSPHTAKLLDVLKEKGVHATFFVLGGQAAKYPDLIRRMYREGHEIASHTWSHPHLMSLTDDQIIAEIKQTEDLIASLTDGRRPRYIRPPYGEADDRVKAIFHAHGLQAVLWNMDTVDYTVVNGNQDPRAIVQAFDKVLTSGASALNPFNNPGFISLQHDIYLKSVEQENDIIDLLANKGLKMVPVSQCTGDGKPYKNQPRSSSPVQPMESQPLPASPVQPSSSAQVQPNDSIPVPGSPVVPEGATSILSPHANLVADGAVSGAADPHAKQLKDSAHQPAGGFLATYNDPKLSADSAASPTLSTGITWTVLVLLLSTVTLTSL